LLLLYRFPAENQAFSEILLFFTRKLLVFCA